MQHWTRCRQFYVPSYLQLEREAERNPLPYRPLTKGRTDKGKQTSTGSPELDAERAWLYRSRAAERAEKDRLAAQEAQDKVRDPSPLSISASRGRHYRGR